MKYIHFFIDHSTPCEDAQDEAIRTGSRERIRGYIASLLQREQEPRTVYYYGITANLPTRGADRRDQTPNCIDPTYTNILDFFDHALSWYITRPD